MLWVTGSLGSCTCHGTLSPWLGPCPAVSRLVFSSREPLGTEGVKCFTSVPPFGTKSHLSAFPSYTTAFFWTLRFPALASINAAWPLLAVCPGRSRSPPQQSAQLCQTEIEIKARTWARFQAASELAQGHPTALSRIRNPDS